MSDLPSIWMIGFPGRRVDWNRAGMIAMAVSDFINAATRQTDLKITWPTLFSNGRFTISRRFGGQPQVAGKLISTDGQSRSISPLIRTFRNGTALATRKIEIIEIHPLLRLHRVQPANIMTALEDSPGSWSKPKEMGV